MNHKHKAHFVNAGIARSTRIKLTLLCAAGFLLFLSGFSFISKEYLHRIEKKAEESFFFSKSQNLRYRIETFFDFYGFTEIRQLYPHQKNNVNKLSFTTGGNVLYVILSDLNGFVILHSDGSQIGSRVNYSENESDITRDKIQLLNVTINGMVQDVCDISLPVVLSGTTQGVLRVGYSCNSNRPILDIEITARTAVNYAFLAVSVFVVIALGLIWYVSLFLSRQTKTAAEKQQQTNRKHLEIIGAGIVHEVKNSLNGIRMNVQLLQEHFDSLPGELKESFMRKTERIQGEASRTADMLSEFLSYAKPDRFNPAPVNLPALLNELSQSFDPECKNRNIKLNCECMAGLTSITADEQQLRHGITNLLWNAIEAIDKNGQINITAVSENSNVMISIEDSGGGMSDDTFNQAFDVFYSTKSQGAGLGLSIVKRVANVHDGVVNIENKPGEGCKFTISFPNL